MGFQKLVIDEKKTDWVPGGAFTLSGWCAVNDGEKAVFSVTDESGTPVEADQKIFSRPDVVKVYPNYADQEDRLGFRILIPDFLQYIADHESLSITVSAGSETQVLLRKSAKELKREYTETSIRYCLESCSYSDTTVSISGWVVDVTGECFPEFTEGDGTPFPIQASRRERPDLAGALGLDDFYKDHAWGFSFSIPREDVKGKVVLMQMKNPYTTKVFRLALNRPLWMSAAAEDFSPAELRRKFGKAKAQIKTRGIKGFFQYLFSERIHLGTSASYESWLKAHRVKPQELRRQKAGHFPYEPLVSIVIPLYNTPVPFLKELIDSILAQSYSNFELCFADGSSEPEAAEFIKAQYADESRIHLQQLKKNGGISENTNAAISMAKGEFLLFSDHDDFLEPDALYEMLALLNRDPELDIIYTDEDLCDESGKHFTSPRFKPDFNPDFLRSINYICHLTMVRTALALKVGLLRKECDGAQDYDFLLRCIEQTDRVGHVPKILYHWRASGESTAGNQDSKQYAIDAGKLALTEHYTRLGYQADVSFTGIFIMYRVSLALRSNPLVTILIPNKDMTDTLDTCVRSIYEKTDYSNFEILIVENNSEEPETFAYYKKMQREHENFRVITYSGSFNYSAINNFGVRQAQGAYILFLNNDTEVISPYWIREMLGFCQREDTAAVGVKLLYPDGQIQHGGVVIGLGGFAGHVHSFSPRNAQGYFGRLCAVQDISAVTAACMLVKRSVFEEAGGFDEEFVVSLNDVDLCLRMRELGYLIVMDPNVELYHFESKTRGYEDSPQKQERFKQEILRFRERWKKILEEGDPYYSPNLTINGSDCQIREKDEKPIVLEQLFGK